jgi:hypothetical protein
MTPSDITIVNRRLDPAESELWITAPEPITGRFMGPHCKFASTVEVAHYLRPLPSDTAAPDYTQRVVVPEPSFWEPETPFLYTGLLQRSSGAIRVRHGMRTISLGPKGLRVNRHPIRVKGARRTNFADAADLRQAGVNTLLVPVRSTATEIWEQADEWGFFVLGEITERAAVPIARALKSHASCLGWIVGDDVAIESLDAIQAIPGREPLIGRHVESPPASLPAGVQFVADGTTQMGGATVPWLALDGPGTSDPLCLGGIEH